MDFEILDIDEATETKLPEVDQVSSFQIQLESGLCGAYSYLYKYKEKHLLYSQAERRESFLREQKEKRHKLADKNRKQIESFCDHSKSVEKEEDSNVSSDYQGKRAPKLCLMSSEWFTEIPEDLNENWVIKFVPQGFRVLVIAQNRRTTFYNGRGCPFLKIQSNFPGGGGSHSSGGPTILDCIFNKATDTLLVLDCLYWNNMSMLDTEARYRFLWLSSKFSEQKDLLRCRKYKFRLLNERPAEQSVLQQEMYQRFKVENHFLPYDGVVFYHKEGHYTVGFTPLVGWLNSYMLPEMFHIDISPANMRRRPNDYQDIHDYLQKLSLRKKILEDQSEEKGEPMDKS